MSTSTQHPLSKILPQTPLGPMRSPARALGWFSIGLGLAELALPRTVARAAGMPNVPPLTRFYGVREIGTGIGLLTSKDPTPWLWGHVAGDALDIATVGTGLVTAGRPWRTLTSIALLLGVACLDMAVAERASMTKKLRAPARDYSARSGFPCPAAEMRGIARRASSPMHAAASSGVIAGRGSAAPSGAQVPVHGAGQPSATYP